MRFEKLVGKRVTVTGHILITQLGPAVYLDDAENSAIVISFDIHKAFNPINYSRGFFYDPIDFLKKYSGNSKYQATGILYYMEARPPHRKASEGYAQGQKACYCFAADSVTIKSIK